MLRLMDEVIFDARDHCAHVLAYLTWQMTQSAAAWQKYAYGRFVV